MASNRPGVAKSGEPLDVGIPFLLGYTRRLGKSPSRTSDHHLARVRRVVKSWGDG